ncbi:ferroxidase fet3 [Coemansia spiralis]|uniref:Ferroxidase fet3 n=2 Tax=Coemansia TaxID=4863 RepID=A0A9W8KWJ5_9FUNG|nr:Cupredoxin [Coemansia spiralis]KAI9506504.1 Cupredoxin [Coemansia spiralis]KAJ1989143.1 ferroxidase fet3 [Coemansia umbellata]KAJ2620110.1 ferroxidase fet3 [Coemansia sp. RSA 1358]KAJ2672781.1 ferroxidase fet3 [Coemansia spiralis]
MLSLGFLVLPIAALARRVEYNWEISNIMTKMDGTHERLAVAVNNQIPMPMVTAELGDTLVLSLRNNLDEPTGLHSHGLLNNGTNYYDGAGMITECGIAPHMEMSYVIPLAQTGTYWLHGHHNSQYINGLRGPLIITDPNEPYEYDDDYVLTFEDWFPHAATMKMGPQRSMKAEDKYPIGVINGMAGDMAPNLPFAANNTYRLRLLNIGSTFMFRFIVDSHDMYIIEADGVATEKHKVGSVLLGVAQRVSVLVVARENSVRNFQYQVEMFTDVFPELPGYNPRAYSGTLLYNEGAELAEYKERAPSDFDDIDLVPLDHQPALIPDTTHDVIITANRTSTDMLQAFINNISFELPQIPSIFTALGYQGEDPLTDSSFGRQCNAKVLKHLSTVELFVANHDRVFHPMHLHGHFFQIVERGPLGGKRVKRSHVPMRRDTVLVAPQSYVKLRFEARNPGVWMMHCHIEKHMELGLSMLFVSAPEVMRQTLEMPESIKEHCRALGISV